MQPLCFSLFLLLFSSLFLFLLSFSFFTVILELLRLKKPAFWHLFTQITANFVRLVFKKFAKHTYVQTYLHPRWLKSGWYRAQATQPGHVFDLNQSGFTAVIWSFWFGPSKWPDIIEIYNHVYGTWQTSDLGCEFLIHVLGNEQIKTLHNKIV